MATSALGTLKESAVGWAWGPAVSLARTAVLRIFSNLQGGSLRIIDEVSGEKHSLGRKVVESNGTRHKIKNVHTMPNVEIVVKRDTFWLRLFLFSDLGFAEGYMLGDFECNDLTSFFRVCPALSNFLN